MKPKYLLDSDVFSLMVKGRDLSIQDRLAGLKAGEAILSVVTCGEFYYGVAHAPLSTMRDQRARRLINFFGVMPLDQDASLAYGQIRADLRARGTPIGPNDLWQAALAQAKGLTLVSRNGREFSRVEGLKVEDWS
ncbi:MAG: PIN domain-containing protein [Burkholderiales bacterium]|nr:PIN domain-containing protein [Burkholderiales bacterium]